VAFRQISVLTLTLITSIFLSACGQQDQFAVRQNETVVLNLRALESGLYSPVDNSKPNAAWVLKFPSDYVQEIRRFKDENGKVTNVAELNFLWPSLKPWKTSHGPREKRWQPNSPSTKWNAPVFDMFDNADHSAFVIAVYLRERPAEHPDALDRHRSARPIVCPNSSVMPYVVAVLKLTDCSDLRNHNAELQRNDGKTSLMIFSFPDPAHVNVSGSNGSGEIDGWDVGIALPIEKISQVDSIFQSVKSVLDGFTIRRDQLKAH
jgi:hypothetical protein